MSDTRAENPKSIPTLFAEAWNRRDPDALAALFEEDAEFVNVTGLWWHNRDAIRRAHAYGLTRIFNASTLTVGVMRVKWLSNEIAVVHARVRLEGQTPIGAVTAPQPRTTIFSFVVRRAEGQWRCASAHNTDVVPHMETNIVDEAGRFSSVSYRRADDS